MIDSLHALLSGVVDYAGLFPPATLTMAPAVHAYADYLNDPHRAMLGRFVIPVARLQEFDDATTAASLLPRGEGSTPWTLSALVGADAEADLARALKFNCQHWSGSDLGHAVIDSVECKAGTAAAIDSAMQKMPKQFRAFFEIATDVDPVPLIQAIKRAGGSAKIRTGGITPDAFPPTEQVVAFLLACRDHGVAFKATAGLHHPIRAPYRLTYDPNPPVGTMYGYLNIFIAALLAWQGAVPSLLQQALEETDAHAFTFTSTALTYRGVTISVNDIQTARQSFVLSFGSCSFREPVDDLAALGLL